MDLLILLQEGHPWIARIEHVPGPKPHKCFNIVLSSIKAHPMWPDCPTSGLSEDMLVRESRRLTKKERERERENNQNKKTESFLHLYDMYICMRTYIQKHTHRLPFALRAT